uniref:Transcription and mRNA export factor ENY2 n=1 Tax=Haptolina ericina TaxID=156174 RepID=A0A7S3C1R6_9EUKA|mmetsp:Transcript_73699/g.163802  ORF Transcript_73699/g.163802 Transcript_73699/m.163802 type:complete len:101 (+) Transcript_73699:44-346(+)|eukprot:CAMPEP_0181182042 /NCGR_PEP_ID=MMETSP1096-20121128/7669_1 /TAXON_ID=156174 ORGANISM="Chrysochromulina ericina, Strain CCMP281" /NCGR_SAMPLE_ID=MMETSP1096 /ASSEMBLY_ACC=CAM_ASM_000453 /LENGTH=100 /DNA_ID=CAMNT_0023270605 /DNA_START=44 /DNA_END=346 /DNA_ORIENTATION=+
MADDAQLRNTIQSKLEESGEYDRLKGELRKKLVDSGWRDELKQFTMDLIRQKGDAGTQMTVEQLTQEITPRGRATVPDEVKAELLQRIRNFVENQTFEAK